MSKGILLVNLGSPKSPEIKDVKNYLAQFLMDKRVIDISFPLRWLLIHGIILRNRPEKTSKAYQSIWTDQGSPLVAISQNVCDKIDRLVSDPVVLAMRYGEPSIQNALKTLISKKPSIDQIYVIPLFPHYAMSSFETAVVEVADQAQKIIPHAKIAVHPPFYDDPNYIRALVNSAKPYLSDDVDHLLFSYHGLPERHLRKTDLTGERCLSSPNCCEGDSPAHATCYRAQVYKTTEAFINQAKMPIPHSISFQSRLGRSPWLQPFTDHVIKELGQKKIKHLAVICPSFVSDCLETLEEIEMRATEDFVSHGGKKLTLVPCLNESKEWIETVSNWCEHFIQS